jgi:hypothetical protein
MAFASTDLGSRKRKRLVTYGRGKQRINRPFLPSDDAMFSPSNPDLSQRPPAVPPRPPPKSQKEAMMPMEPSESDVENVCNFACCDRETAVTWLKVRVVDVSEEKVVYY